MTFSRSRASPIFKGYQIYHNYIRQHEGLNGKTPAEAANIHIDGANKWMTIIQNAVHQSQPLKVK
jgi:hypothetical protein